MSARRSGAARREARLQDAIVVNTCAVTAEAVRQSRQAIRKATRERPACAAHRHRLRGADRARDLSPPCPKSIAVLGNAEKMRAGSWRALAALPRPATISGLLRRAAARQRHHGGDGNRAPPGRPLRRAAPAPSCRCRTAAITAAPSASSPTAGAIRAACRWARSWRRARRLVEKGFRRRSCSPASISPLMARICRARRRWARW